jgi:hypothetical protein
MRFQSTSLGMKTLPVRLGISDGEWHVFRWPAAATLEHLSIPAQKKEVVLAFLISLQKDFVAGRQT